MTGGNVGLNLKLSALAQFQPASAFAPVSLSLDASRLAPVIRSMLFGADAGLMNLIVAQPRTLQAGANETLNLFDGSLLDILGASAPFRQIKWFVCWIISGGDTS